MSGFWDEPVGPMVQEEKQAFADAVFFNTTTRTEAEFMYCLNGWKEEELKNVLALRRLVAAGILDPREED